MAEAELLKRGLGNFSSMQGRPSFAGSVSALVMTSSALGVSRAAAVRLLSHSLRPTPPPHLIA
eukprot:1858663-Rhodomonas_salina.3